VARYREEFDHAHREARAEAARDYLVGDLGEAACAATDDNIW
jgi:hypothetical protein